MKDAPSTWNDKVIAPIYKLLSDIEVTTDFKKVGEERVLNRKVKFTFEKKYWNCKRKVT